MHHFTARALSAFLGNFGAFVGRPSRRGRFNVNMSARRKYYAIRGGKGGYRGIVNTWEDCQRLVNGVSNVRFKSFNSLEEAKVFTGVAPSTASASTSVFKAGRKKTVVPRKMSTLKGALTVFTDGACSRNGQRGASAGYGVYFGEDNEHNVSERLVGEPTNQRAEMTAVIVAMQAAFEKGLVSPKKGLLVMTDSMYTLNGITKWISSWKKKGWKTTTSADVKNQDLWKKLDEWRTKYATAGIPFDIIWVKGHEGTPGNEAADRLAVAGLLKPVPATDPTAKPDSNPELLIKGESDLQ